MDQDHPSSKPRPVSRRTLRLTFRASEKGLELLSQERIEMITPPQPGEPPQAGRHGGWWFELRDDEGRALAHRVVDASLLESVEVHSPEGRIERRFGAPAARVFEVLLPDVDKAGRAVLVGSPLRRAAAPKAGERAEVSADIASFDLAPRGERR